MESQLINQGVTLMLAGMGTVFAFLTTLVAAMTLMSRVVMRLEVNAAAAEVSDAEVAAISAAITAHRRVRSKSVNTKST